MIDISGHKKGEQKCAKQRKRDTGRLEEESEESIRYIC